MTTRPDSLGGHILQPPVVPAVTAWEFSRRFKERTFRFKKKVVLTMKDLDLLTSLYIARFIMWRTRSARDTKYTIP